MDEIEISKRKNDKSMKADSIDGKGQYTELVLL